MDTFKRFELYNCNDPTFNISLSQYFYLTITDRYGCVNSDSVLVSVSDESSVFIPNAFTPNNDGLNDQFIVKGDDIESVQMLIFNRWGDEIFQSNDKNVGWNGIYKSKLVEPLVYVYKIKVNEFRGTTTIQLIIEEIKASV